MNQHTKGEWRVSDARGGQLSIIGETGKQVATIFSYIGTPELEKEANARLIAAAPDMYEALKEALSYFKRLADEGHYPEFMITENGGHGWENLAKVLRKVEGK